MKNIKLLAKSSSGKKPYSVDFTIIGGKMTVRCNCPAGRYGKLCKHKISMIEEDYDILYDENQDKQLYEISDLIQKSDFLDLIFERSKAKTALGEAQEKLDTVKKKMAQAIKNGINLYSYKE